MRKILLAFLLCELSFGWTLGGAPDRQGWQTKELTINVNYDNCPISEAALNDSIDAALDLWSGLTEADITLKRGTSTTTVAEFSANTGTDPPWIFCDPDMSTTIGTSANNIPGVVPGMSSNPLSYGAILLNAEVTAAASIDNISETTLDLTIAHEMGHLLGLGHSSQQSSLMYFSLTGKSELFLSQDDRDGMAYLYPRNEFSNAPFGCAAVHNQPVQPLSLAMGFSLLLVFLFGLLATGRLITAPARRCHIHRP